MLKIELDDNLISQKMKNIKIYDDFTNYSNKSVQNPVYVYKSDDNIFIRFTKNDPLGNFVWIHWKDLTDQEEVELNKTLQYFTDNSTKIITSSLPIRN